MKLDPDQKGTGNSLQELIYGNLQETVDPDQAVADDQLIYYDE